jgi:hypothetical protein
MRVEEVSIDCPYCGEEISILIDSSVGSQEYIEDCQVCCRPIEIVVTCVEGGGPHISVRAEDETRHGGW